jgi:hypothetical protein
VVRFERVAERSVEPHLTDVVSTLFVADHKSGFDQIRDDAMDGSLADSHQPGHVDEPNFRVQRDAQQNVGVIGQECPPPEQGESKSGRFPSEKRCSSVQSAVGWRQ